MNFFEQYCHYHEKFGYKKLVLNDAPSPNLGLVVVIPCYKETNILKTLENLRRCFSPISDVEIIIVINASETDNIGVKETNNKTTLDIENWKESVDEKWLKFLCIIENDLPKKHAGVGLARKIGMDLAAERLFTVGRSDAPIVCFDADSCCEKNYLIEIEKHFNANKDISACSIYFEHPIKGLEYSKEVYSAIALYELHLRYYRQGLVFTSAPFAFHTIGSSMAVRAMDYCKQGGMNKRKAGEDFYFLQKFIELGNFSEINSTTVIPSPRASDRVPFGTGRAVGQHLNQQRDIGLSYNPQSFLILKDFFEATPFLYEESYKHIPAEVINFIGSETLLINEIKKIKQQSSSYAAFNKRFFRWFNAFKTLKFIHFLREKGLEEISVQQAATELEKMMGRSGGEKDTLELLQRYREYDKKFSFAQISAEGSPG